MKRVFMIFLVLILFVFSTACTKNETNNKINSNKEVVYVGGAVADFRESYKNIAELTKGSEVIFKGKVDGIKSIVEDNSVVSLVDFLIEDTYKGDNGLKTIRVSIMGGLMDGDEFINSSIGQMFIDKGSSEAELIKLYSGKNVRFAGFEGEVIPEIGKSYIVFARDSLVKKDIFYIVGGGYEQGLLEVVDRSLVYEFSPEKRTDKQGSQTINIEKLIADINQ